MVLEASCLHFVNTKVNKIMTKSDKLIKALKEGEELTAKQISSRFGIGNPSATVSDLRYKGYAVYGNLKKNSRGKKTTFYRLGAPSRAVVAAGYRALGAG